ncbi:gamma-glutamyltransferase family protein [Desulfosoma sp.]
MRTFGNTFGQSSEGQPAMGFYGAVATEHYLSAQAAMDILKAGGNAFDAAAAATFVEGLVNPHMFTLGGECPMVLYVADEDTVVAVNGNTEAPASASLENYRSRGMDLIPPQGMPAAGVPAAVASLLDMVHRYGRLPLQDVLGPVKTLCSRGFPVHEGLIKMPRFGIEDNAALFQKEWRASAQLYLDPDGKTPSPGSRLVNASYGRVVDFLLEEARRYGHDRAAGIRAARKAFYEGDIAEELEHFVRERDGFLTRSDLASYETLFEKPVSVPFRNTQVYKCGPWSQGPVFLQMLRLLKGFDLESLGWHSASYLHTWVEAAKLAFADREQYYGDPRFVDVPLEALLSASYAQVRRTLIDPDRASTAHRPGDPRRGKPLLPAEAVFRWDRWGYGTVHVAVADSFGNMAALTPSGGWISGNEVVPSLGFPLGTRLQTFYLDPAHPNALRPRKRPRTTLTPSLAFRDGRLWMAFGTMGGDQQDQWTLQFFLNRAVFGMSVQEAIEAPKICSDHFPGTFYPHDAFPARLRVESRISEDTRRSLEALGHRVVVEGPWSLGFICAVSRERDGLWVSGADPRGHRAAVFPSCALAW